MKKLTTLQRKFWAHYVEHQSLAAAAQYAGCKCKSLQSYSTVGRQILNSLEPSFNELLDAMGLDDATLARKTGEGLEATRTHLASYEGKFTDEREVPDYSTRAKYVELLGRLKGKFIDKHELSGRDGGDLILQVAPRMGNRKSNDLEIE